MQCREAGLALARANLPQGTLARAFYEGYLHAPHKRMAVGVNESMTYAEAYRRANVLAWHLRRECGVGVGSMVGISSPNDLHVPVAMAAAQMCGANIVHLPPGLQDFEFERNVSLVPPDVFIVSSERTLAMVERFAPGKPTLMIGCTGGACLSVDEVSSHSLLGSGWEFPAVPAETTIALYSSGSTGAPKAIVNYARSFSLNAVALRKALSLTPDDVIYVPVPFAHVFGIVGIYAAIVVGATLVTSAKYRPETALSLLSSTRATVHLGVATMFLRELRENADDEWDLTSLRAGLVAGAGCPASVLYDFEERYGCRIMQSYGMTETAATLTVTPLDTPVAVRVRTVGMAIEGAEVKLDPATGEVLCKTRSLMAGIVSERGVCKLELDEGGWLRTGDVGAIDEEGMLSVVGRIKDIVIRGGINIFPAEVEALYEGCPGVVESCLVGYPDPELGERTCLCVILEQGSTASSLELRQFAQGRTEKCRIPDIVMRLDDFPRLANGKINKNALKDLVKTALGA